MFRSLYRPRTWPALAAHIASAISGDGSGIVNDLLQAVELNRSVPADTFASNRAVVCSDSRGEPDVSDEEAFKSMLKYIAEVQQSTTWNFAGLGPSTCYHWRAIKPIERYTGPFNHTLKNEILIIGNTADVRGFNAICIMMKTLPHARPT